MINKKDKLLFLFISLLSMGFLMIKQDSEPAEYLKYVDEVVKSFVAQMEKELRLRCIGDGGSMPRDVEKIQIYFSTNRRANLYEAREIEITAAEKFLHTINTNLKIRPYLREYPFTPERISVIINFNDELNKRYSDESITSVSLVKGNIYFDINDPIDDKLIDFLEEPYEDAKKFVEQNPLNRDLRHHLASPYEAHVDQMLNAFAVEVKKKWGLIWWASGGRMADGIEEFAVSLITPHRASLEKARKLEVEITERLLEIVNSDEVIRPYLKEYPFKPNRAKVAIKFKKYDNSYYEDGSIAIVKQEDNRVFYFTLNPREPGRIAIRSDPLSDESYEDAKQMVQKQEVN